MKYAPAGIWTRDHWL